MTIQQLLSEVTDFMKEKGAEKVILFGSFAWGNPESDSDIDLLIIKDLPKELTRNYRIGLKKELWKKFKDEKKTFDIIVDSDSRINERINMGDLFYKEIYNKGKVLYA